MSDKIEEIRARHAGYSLENFGNAHLANEDRGWLLAEVDRLRAENERLKTLALGGWAGDSDPAAVLSKVEKLRAENERLREALTDMLSGWRYIRETYGDLAGIGWDRAEQKARKALEGRP